MDTHRAAIRNEILIVLLALASCSLLVFELVSDASQEQMAWIQRIDLAIALVFLGEFLIRLAKADNRRQFFRRFWWELLAAIPITGHAARALRGLPLLRTIRVIRLLRLVRLTARVRVLIKDSHAFIHGAWLIEISTSVVALVSAAALSFHYFEHGTNPNVHTVADSFWWAIVTVTTVGYGDIYPITTGGRLIAVGLMLVGIGTLGLYSAAIASFVVKRHMEEEDRK
ncbi:MAG TPA: potassium channel family protein [Thermoanaerobaculia bacterium]|nr:potassium channel family protein [Thermoanaerobaculia bacterium]